MSQTARKTKVAVVFGGRSEEHSISCVSASNVIRALDPQRYEVIPIGISKQGHWVIQPDAADFSIGSDGNLPEVGAGTPVALTRNAELISTDTSQPAKSWGQIDVVFPVLHGPWGQDGTLQGLLELSGVRYVGAGVLSSAVGTDKHFMKQLFVANGLPVQPWVLARPHQWQTDPEAIREAVRGLGGAVFVKPARAGSSFGITRVAAGEAIDAAVEHARGLDPKVLIEAAADRPREVEIGVIGNPSGGRPLTSEIAEIKVGGEHAFYDFEAKYLPEQHTDLDVPADLPDDIVEQVKDLAVKAFVALDVEGLARVDFFILPSGRVVLNEVETMPGFTTTSMFPQMWAASGLDYPSLLDHLIGLAMSRPTGLR
ncbi:MAG TPA: D-alanine--D-alanine ligase family protein [Marmoricola sp.]|nr:D-alanine--D-alanine ligase [Nocardioidaceae bacterium]MCB8993194.1 D-alanine--D-alanine ligase [Nocardioidaceae bacterium]MCO5323122.1 D-alanine--D-alanine ligase [Nocardioidaceae bacterium]HMY08375.1 D-alanine--D-alanine ligase family protein [Marmoricola sp.]HRV68904.1 D-alanine--D-alanine ligase family protein [Marmoricola sp.]